jgi:cytochrome c oxidase subunit IV
MTVTHQVMYSISAVSYICDVFPLQQTIFWDVLVSGTCLSYNKEVTNACIYVYNLMCSVVVI